MKFKSCIFSDQKIHILEILEHQNFNNEFKILVKNVHTQFLEQSASEALHKVEGTKKIKKKSFHQYS